MTVGGLQLLCEKNIVEILFTRRNKSVSPSTRRILCTRDTVFLNSSLTKQIFNFTPPTQPHPYNAASKGLVTVYDLIMQDWRNIPASSCEPVMAIPTQPEQRFWEFFDKKLKNMTTDQKRNFLLNSAGSMYGYKPTGQKFYQVRTEKGQFYKVNQ
jgi:hypothetical protein